MPSTRPEVRLLIVDHSPAARDKLRGLFGAKEGIRVIGEAGTAQKALRLLAEVSPTVVLLDCDMPGQGSFALVKEMMALYRVPIVMLTKQGRLVPRALEQNALEAGAVSIVALTGEGLTTDKMAQEGLAKTVRTMSEVKVVRRRSGPRQTETAEAPATAAGQHPSPRRDAGVEETVIHESSEVPELLAIGASTGGPQVIQTILRGLSGRLTVPVVIVQHLSQGFQRNLIQWLAESTGVSIRLAEHGMPLVPGVVYLAPDDSHLEVSGSRRLVLTDGPAENGSRPSVSVLFRSVAKHYGPSAIGVLLSGMGRDGAKELKAMRDRGAVTIAQDEETSAVHGMPGEAIKLGGARYVLPPDRIVSVIGHRLPAAPAGQPGTTVCA